MRKQIFTLMALMAVLCACNKEQFIESEITEPDIETSAPLVFTATMESTPGTKATLDGLTPSWEVGDQVSINDCQYTARTAGFITTFSAPTTEISPTFISGSPVPDTNTTPPELLVDAKGTSTKWCADVIDGGIYIIVSADTEYKLSSIKLWNGGDTGNRPGRRWKDVKVYGASSADGPWDSDALLASFTSLNLEANNGGFAGELPVGSTKKYKYYKIEVLSTMGESLQQMSDMKFVVVSYNIIRPTYVSTSTPGHYGNLDASMLVDDSGTANEWCTPTSAKDGGVWNIVVSTGNAKVLKTIKLWNARNTETYYGRTWKKVKVYGSTSANGPWGEAIGDFDNLELAINNYGFAGELEINATEAYTYYKIDVLENKGGTGDDYMQMSDMQFVVDSPSLTAPYNAYFPASLYDGTTAVLPAAVTETWADGKFNMPMYAQSEDTDLQFKNLCGVLKINVRSGQMEKVKCIRISSSNKAISGEFTVDGNNAAVLKNPGAVANTLTVTYTDAVQTTEEGTSFYVAVPAQTYRSLSIKVSDDGLIFRDMVTKDGADITVERNKIYPVAFSFSPNGTIGSAYVKSLKRNVKWVQLWKDGPKFAEMNVGATECGDYGGYYGQNEASDRVAGWGDAWRMPKKTDLDGLASTSKCDSRWIVFSGVPGRIYTGKGEYANNSIFLPAAGHKSVMSQAFEGKNAVGYYLTSTINVAGSDAYKLKFTSSSNTCETWAANIYYLESIRPVLAE